MATGARVSNAYPTCPCPPDNPSKGGLTRYAEAEFKALMEGSGQKKVQKAYDLLTKVA